MTYIINAKLWYVMCISFSVMCGSSKADEVKYENSINAPNADSVPSAQRNGHDETCHFSKVKDKNIKLERQERDLLDYGDYQFDRDLPDLGNAKLHLFSWWKGSEGKKMNNGTPSNHLKSNPTIKLQQGSDVTLVSSTLISNGSAPVNMTTPSSGNGTSPTVNMTASTAAGVPATASTTVSENTASSYLTTCYTVTDTCLPLLTLVAAPICTQENSSATSNSDTAAMANTSVSSTKQSSVNGTTASMTSPVTPLTEAAASGTSVANTGSFGNSTTPVLVQFAQQAIPNPFSMVSGSMVIPVYRIPPVTKIILANTPILPEASTVSADSPETEKMEHNYKDAQLTESVNTDENDIVNKHIQHHYSMETNRVNSGNTQSTILSEHAFLNDFVTKISFQTQSHSIIEDSYKSENSLTNMEPSDKYFQKEIKLENKYLNSQHTLINKPINEQVQNNGENLPESEIQKNNTSQVIIPSNQNTIIDNSGLSMNIPDMDLDVTNIYDQQEPIVNHLEPKMQIPNTISSRPKYIDNGGDKFQRQKVKNRDFGHIEAGNTINVNSKLKNGSSSSNEEEEKLIQNNESFSNNDKYDTKTSSGNENWATIKDEYTRHSYSEQDQKTNSGVPILNNPATYVLHKTISSSPENKELSKTINLYNEQKVLRSETLPKENNFNRSFSYIKKPLTSAVVIDQDLKITRNQHSFTDLNNSRDEVSSKSHTSNRNNVSNWKINSDSKMLFNNYWVPVNQVDQININTQLQKGYSISPKFLTNSVYYTNIPHDLQPKTNNEENSGQISGVLSKESNVNNLNQRNSSSSINDLDNSKILHNEQNNVAVTHFDQMDSKRVNSTINIENNAASVYFKYNDTFLARHSTNNQNLTDICRNVTCKGNDYLAQCCGQKICPPGKCQGEDFSYLHPIPGDTTTTSIKPCCKEKVNQMFTNKGNFSDNLQHSKKFINFSNVRVTRENEMNDFVKFQLMHGITAPDGKDLINALKEAKFQMQKVSKEFHPESGIKNIQTVHQIPIAERQIKPYENKPPFIDTNKILENLRTTITESLYHTKLKNNPIEKYRTIRNQGVNEAGDIIKENVILDKLREESETELRRISELELRRRQEEELFNKEKENNLKELRTIRELIQKQVVNERLPTYEKVKEALNYPENLVSFNIGGKLENEGSYSKLVKQIANSVNINEAKDLSFDRYSDVKSSNVTNLQNPESSPVGILLTENKFPELDLKRTINGPNDASIPIIKMDSNINSVDTKRKKRYNAKEKYGRIGDNVQQNEVNTIVVEDINNLEQNFDSLHDDLFDLQKYIASKMGMERGNALSPDKLSAPANDYNISYIKRNINF